MSVLQVRPVNNRASKKEFLDFPYRLYRHDRCWVPPLRVEQRETLDPARNPFFEHADLCCFVATLETEVCGRIAAIIDRDANAARNEAVGTFGFFECIDSQPVANALFQAAADWLSGRSMNLMRGPMSPSINYEAGLLVVGFDSPPRIMMTYNPPYYEKLFDGVGLTKARDLYAYLIAAGDSQTDEARWKRVERAMRVLPAGEFKIRTMDPATFATDVDSIWRLHTAAWQHNWGAAPFSQNEFRHLARRLKPILIPELTLLAEVEGLPVGFGLVVPNMNEALRHANGSLFPLGLLKILYQKRKVKTLRILAVGVSEKYRNTCLAATIYLRLIRAGMKLGYTEAEASWVAEDNGPMNRTMELLSMPIYKTYRIYEKPLGILAEIACTETQRSHVPSPGI